LAERFFALRARLNSRLQSVGSAALRSYVVDKSFEGEDDYRRWLDRYGAQLICPPKRTESKRRWPKRLGRWAASIRQVVETVYDKLHNTFGLRRERPHDMRAGCGRGGGEGGSDNFCIWLNEQLWRPLPRSPPCWTGKLPSHQAVLLRVIRLNRFNGRGGCSDVRGRRRVLCPVRLTSG
jgi:hypothetical protein